eukprot:10748541-Prorocentrum_lima.AAC.1
MVLVSEGSMQHTSSNRMGSIWIIAMGGLTGGQRWVDNLYSIHRPPSRGLKRENKESSMSQQGHI